MRPKRALLAAAPVLLAAVAATRAFPGPPIDPIEARSILRKKLGALPVQQTVAPQKYDVGKKACDTAHDRTLQEAWRTVQACCDNPPPDSPAGKFNALTNQQLGAFCGSKSLAQCTDEVAQQQIAYCKSHVYPPYSQVTYRADEDLRECRECDTWRDKKRALEEQLKQLDQLLLSHDCARFPTG